MKITTTLLAMLTAASLGAQMPDGSANLAAIEKIRFAEGRWVGTAWREMAPGRRDTTSMVETVERKLGGAVLLVEGKGSAGGRVVHHALGILSYDARAKQYMMRSWLNNGLTGEFPLTVTANTLQWSREVPGGRIRNTATYTATEWVEIGEFSRDGTTWSTMMEIRLRKEP